MKIKAIYTLYEIKVPDICYEDYWYFLNKWPYMDVSDFDNEINVLWIGLAYETKKEQKKLLKKLTKGLKKYYKED